MKVISLQSGSNGNCYYVESCGTSLLIDAGISARLAESRLAEHGRDIRQVDGLFITHDHSDHCNSLGAFNRKFGLKIYITRATLRAVSRYQQIGVLSKVKIFSAGVTQHVGKLAVHSVPTPHDAAEGVAYVIEDAVHRVGILTDLGHAFGGLKDVLRSLDAVVIESNYDEKMLSEGFYPEHLKQRIRGKGGHLSNEEAAKLLSRAGNKRLRWACLCHLSEENNCPETALRTHQKWLGDDLQIFVASRYGSSEAMEL